MPVGVWRTAFSMRFSARRCSSSREPSTIARFASTCSSWPSATADELARGLHEHLADVGRGVRRVALGVRAGEEQQVGDEAAHAAAGAQGGGGRLAALAVERLGEQLEVREHARERRAQLVGGVGDELALALERAPPSRCARASSARSMSSSVGASSATSSSASVVGTRRAGSRVRPISRAAAVSSAIGAIARVAIHRPARSARPAPLRTPTSRKKRTRFTVASTSRERAPVLQVDVADLEVVEVPADLHAAVLDPVAVELDRRPVRRVAEPARRAVGLLDHLAVAVHDLRHRVRAADVRVQARALDVELVRDARVDDEPVPEPVGRARDLGVEVGVDALRRERADGAREAAEDDEREERGSAGEAPADRDAPRRGERSPRRGSYGGGAARHRLPASFAGWRRRPRWCSSSRTGRSPRPPRAAAGAAPRCARCA